MGPIERLAKLATPILNIPAVRRTRRNHGLEHATIHILSRRIANLRMAGRSDSRGFYLYGDVSTEDIEAAVAEALRRMREGQHNLAVHPNCGTNLLTAGVLASASAMLASAGADRDGWRSRAERFPTVVMMVVGTLLIAPGLGMGFQRHFTTLGEPGDLDIKEIRRHEVNPPFGDGTLTVHRVDTRNG